LLPATLSSDPDHTSFIELQIGAQPPVKVLEINHVRWGSVIDPLFRHTMPSDEKNRMVYEVTFSHNPDRQYHFFGENEVGWLASK
jgi:hypothetical protein